MLGRGLAPSVQGVFVAAIGNDLLWSAELKTEYGLQGRQSGREIEYK